MIHKATGKIKPQKDECNPNGAEADQAIIIGQKNKNDYTIRDRLNHSTKKYAGFTAFRIGDIMHSTVLDIALDDPHEFIKAILREQKELVKFLVNHFGHLRFNTALLEVDFEDKKMIEEMKKVESAIHGRV